MVREREGHGQGKAIIFLISMMRFTFLGTGTSQGIPVIGCDCRVCKSSDPRDKRLRCSLLIESSHHTVLIDAGPDFRQQMLRAGVKKLDAIVFTHEHMDHLSGLDDVRAFNYFQQKPMPLYARPAVQQRLRQQYAYIFDNSGYPGLPQVEMREIGQGPFQIGDITLHPIELMHAEMPVLGFRMGDFTYITDANYIAEAEKEKVKGSQVITLNALRREQHHSHFSLSEALALAAELNCPSTYLLHLSHQMGTHAEIAQELPAGVHLAYDELIVNL